MKRQILLGLSVLVIAGAAFAGKDVARGASSDGKATACAYAKHDVPSDATITKDCYCDEPTDKNDFMKDKWVCFVDYERKD